MEEKKKKASPPDQKKLWLIVLVICGVVALAVAAAQFSGSPPAPPVEAGPEGPYPAEEYTGYELETPIGTLYYPEEWADCIRVEQKTVGETFSADFYSELEHEDAVLFSLYIGTEGRGYQMGSLDGRSVWIDIQAADPDPDWSEAEKAQVADMQDRVNDVMDQIYKLEGFEKSQPEM